MMKNLKKVIHIIGYSTTKTVLLALKSTHEYDELKEAIKNWTEIENLNIFYSDCETNLVVFPCFCMIIDRAFGFENTYIQNSTRYWDFYVEYCKNSNTKDIDLLSKATCPIIIVDDLNPSDIFIIAEQLQYPIFLSQQYVIKMLIV